MNTLEIRHMTLQVVAGAIRHSVTGFLLDRRSRNLSHNTIIYYHQELNFFIDFLDSQGVTMLDELNAELIRLYLVGLSQKRNGGGCHAAYRAIRAFLLWAWDEYDLPTRNPIDKVNAPKRSKDVIPGIPLEDVHAMVDACKGDNLATRDKAILLTLIDTGARAFEVTAWDVASLDISAGSLTIEHGKGDKKRSVFIGKTTRRALTAYLRTREKVRDGSPLFVTRDNERFTVQGLRRMIEKRAAQAGVNVPGLHDFRRCFALNCLRSGMDLITLQALMGHSDLSTLKRYVLLDDDDLRQTHSQNSPVERMKGR